MGFGVWLCFLVVFLNICLVLVFGLVLVLVLVWHCIFVSFLCPFSESLELAERLLRTRHAFEELRLPKKSKEPSLEA